MGWSVFENTTKPQVVEHVLNSELCWINDDVKVLKHSLRGQCLWYLAHTRSTDRKWIGLVLIRSVGKGQIGVKHMDESVGPCYYNCPVSWLQECSEPVCHAAQWREQVRQRANQVHADTRRLQCLKNETRLRYANQTYTLEYWRPKKGWIAVDEAGIRWKISRGVLLKAEVLEQD